MRRVRKEKIQTRRCKKFTKRKCRQDDAISSQRGNADKTMQKVHKDVMYTRRCKKFTRRKYRKDNAESSLGGGNADKTKRKVHSEDAAAWKLIEAKQGL